MSFKSRLLASRQVGNLVYAGADRTTIIASIVIGIAPLFFLTVKSWTNAAVLVLFVVAIYDAVQTPNAYRALFRDRRIVWLSIALGSAFVAILAAQILRFDIRPPAYDGPLRPLAGILIMMLLVVRKVDFIRIF